MNSSKAAPIQDAGTTSYLDPDALHALNLAAGASKPGSPEPGEPMACQGKRETCTSKPAPKPAEKERGEPMACQGKSR